MYMCLFRLFCLLAVFLIIQDIQASRWNAPSIYDEIHDYSELSVFDEILLDNSVIRDFLEYNTITIFAPLNTAFQQFGGDITIELGSYHVCVGYDNMTVENLKTVPFLSSLSTGIPLWLTSFKGDVYVNQARVIHNRSVYREPAKNQYQALHMIDAVLDPMVRSSGFAPSAYDFLQDVHKWNFGGAISVTKFFDKVQLYELVDLYDKIPHTFFIPIDSGMNLYKYEMITKKIVRRHVVRHQVAFSRPQGRVVTNIDDAGSLYQFSFEKINNTLFVKCVSNYSTHITQYSVKVLVPDIPMRNGVVHLISEPLGNFFEILRPLPYLPIIEKVTNDIEIDVFYQMGNATGFNNVFDRKGVNFTYFVPKDSAWYKTSKLGLEPIGSFKNILSRHLVISKEPHSMQQLVWMTRDNHYRPIKLMSERGPLRISVFEIEDQYLIKWRKKYIKVLRPDYLCTNGIVHILSGPFVNFRQQKLERYNDSSKVSNYWKIVNDIHT